MQGYSTKIEEVTLNNPHFRQVLYTGKFTQLVLMTLQPGEEIGLETHGAVDQFFRIEAGSAKFVLAGEEMAVATGFAVIVPAGTEHNVVNIGTEPLKMYTLYSPPNHPDGTVHKTKAEAQAAEKHPQ